MARNVYYPYDFEAHKNLSHKQFPIKVHYFLDHDVFLLLYIVIYIFKPFGTVTDISGQNIIFWVFYFLTSTLFGPVRGTVFWSG